MNKWLLLALCIFLGPFGGHYFATKRWRMGILYLCTFGLLYVGWIVDIIRILTDKFPTEVAPRLTREERLAKYQAKMDEYKAQHKPKFENTDNLAHCPKCNSTSLSAHKKGFGLGKALVGSAIVLPLGAVTGAIGKNKVYIVCMSCGHKFKPGKK